LARAQTALILILLVLAQCEVQVHLDQQVVGILVTVVATAATAVNTVVAALVGILVAAVHKISQALVVALLVAVAIHPHMGELQVAEQDLLAKVQAELRLHHLGLQDEVGQVVKTE
jgi:hypothetical protein